MVKDAETKSFLEIFPIETTSLPLQPLPMQQMGSNQQTMGPMVNKPPSNAENQELINNLNEEQIETNNLTNEDQVKEKETGLFGMVFRALYQNINIYTANQTET